MLTRRLWSGHSNEITQKIPWGDYNLPRYFSFEFGLHHSLGPPTCDQKKYTLAITFFKSFRHPTMMSRRPASSVFLHGRVKECSRPAAVYKFSDPSRKFRPTLRNPWDDNT